VNTFILIVVLILWIAVRSHAAQAKRKAEMENAASEPSQPSHSSARSAFESLFEEERETESAYSSFAQEGQSAGYYSYESVVGDDLAPGRTTTDFVSDSKPETMAQFNADDSKGVDFDLRQAVIAQTILSNKYLNEIYSDVN
jgi:hypothetical protein